MKAKRRKFDAKGDGKCPHLVIEEMTKLLDRECALSHEVAYRNGKRIPLLTGGRDNEKFILAIRTSDGKWPEVPSNEQTVNVILAAVRASQNSHEEISKQPGRR